MPPRWIEDLGLDDIDTDAPDRVLGLAHPEVGQAFSRTPGRLRLPELVSDDSGLADVLETAPYPLTDLSPPEVVAFAGDPRVVLVSLRGASEELRTGVVQVEHAGEWILDGRAAPAGVVLATAAERFAVVVTADDAMVFDLSTLGPPPPELELDLPDLEALLHGAAIEPWLTERVRTLCAADDPYLRVVAAGTLARMWAPRDPAATLQRLMAGESGGVGQLRSWARAIRAPVREALLDEAFRDVSVCHELLDEIRLAAIEARPDAARRALRVLVERRDALASARWVLGGGGGRVPEIDGSLKELDERARAAWSERPRPSGLSDVRWIGELAAREPDAWWGQP